MAIGGRSFKRGFFQGRCPWPHFLSCLDTRKEVKKIKAKQKSFRHSHQPGPAVLPGPARKNCVLKRDFFLRISVQGLQEGFAGRGQRVGGALEARVFSGALPLRPQLLFCLDTKK
jgi:hypothetical protein